MEEEFNFSLSKKGTIKSLNQTDEFNPEIKKEEIEEEIKIDETDERIGMSVE